MDHLLIVEFLNNGPMRVSGFPSTVPVMSRKTNEYNTEGLTISLERLQNMPKDDIDFS